MYVIKNARANSQLTAASFTEPCNWCTLTAIVWWWSRANARASTSVHGLIPALSCDKSRETHREQQVIIRDCLEFYIQTCTQ